MAVILTKLLIIKSVSEIQCLICWFFLLFYEGSSHLRVAVCWNFTGYVHIKKTICSHLRVAVCWNIRITSTVRIYIKQPPSGGCVLKPSHFNDRLSNNSAATFGWLCVETIKLADIAVGVNAATFGWLCVETAISSNIGRFTAGSHLRVAVCWNFLWKQ